MDENTAGAGEVEKKHIGLCELDQDTFCVLLSHLHDSIRFVLYHVNKSLHSRLELAESGFEANPLEHFLENGYENLVEWAIETPAPCFISPACLTAALRCVPINRKFVEFILGRGVTVKGEHIWACCKQRCAEIITLLLDRVEDNYHAYLRSDIMKFALEEMDLPSLRFYFETPTISISNSDLTELVKFGDKDFLNWVMTNFFVSFDFMSDFTLSTIPNLDLLQWVMSKMRNPGSISLVLAYAVENNASLVEDAINANIQIPLSKYNDPKIVRLLLSRNINIGHFKTNFVLKLARDGDFELFQNPLNTEPLTPDLYCAAIEGGNVDLIKYLEAKGCPLPNGDTIFRHCIIGGSAEVADYLYEKGIRWTTSADSYFDVTRTYYSFRMVKWLVEHGWKVDFNSWIIHYKTHSFELLRYLHETQGLGLRCVEFSYLDEREVFPVMRYIHSKYGRFRIPSLLRGMRNHCQAAMRLYRASMLLKVSVTLREATDFLLSMNWLRPFRRYYDMSFRRFIDFLLESVDDAHGLVDAIIPMIDEDLKNHPCSPDIVDAAAKWKAWLQSRL